MPTLRSRMLCRTWSLEGAAPGWLNYLSLKTPLACRHLLGRAAKNRIHAGLGAPLPCGATPAQTGADTPVATTGLS